MAITAPDVAPEPIPGVRIQPAANETTFGAGPGLQQIGGDIQKIATDSGDIAAFEKIRADQTAVETAQAKMSQASLGILYDPQIGVMGSKGTDALEAQKNGMEQFKKTANDISSSLNGPQQIGAFNKWVLEHGATIERTMMGHADEQLQKHDENTFNSLVSNQAALASLSHGDPQATATALRTVNENAVAYAQRNRFDKDATDKLVQDSSDKMHTAVIDGMLKFQNDGSAQKYYDANKDQMSPDARLKVQDGLSEGSIRFSSSSAAQSIMAKHPDSEADALAATNKISNPEVQDTARKLISTNFAQNRQAQKNDQDALFMNMSKMVNQKGLTDPVDRRNAVPPMAWSRLSSEQQRAIEKGGDVDETSIGKWIDFKQTIADGSTAKISRADLQSKYLQYMTPADQKTVVDQWSSAQKGSDNPKLLRDQTVSKSIDDSLSTAGLIPPTTKQRSPSDNLALKQVDDNVHRDIIGFESSQNRSPKPDEVQAIVDKRTIEAIGNKPPGFFARFSAAAPTPYEAIPEKAKEQSVQLARSVGGVATRQKIEQAYQLHRQGKSDDEIAKIFK